MKNQYVGDVNDFAKYSLLRELLAAVPRLGVCWMLTADDGRGDGRLTAYLRRPAKYRYLDPPLFDALERAFRNERSIKAIEQSGILSEALFFSEPLSDNGAARLEYFEQLWPAVRGADVVFFDPDNGLEVASVGFGQRNSSKYLYWQEVDAALSRDHSVVVYQHYPRLPRAPFTRALLNELKHRFPDTSSLSVYTSRVAYLMCAQPRHAEPLAAAARRFTGRWSRLVSIAHAPSE